MKKNKYLLAATPIFLGVIGLIVYNMMGSRVEPDGTLVEPFFLIPISCLFIFSGMISVVFVSMLSRFKRSKLN
ncbi:DUF3955 domain-containing protein [Bacillus sp. FJAT-52991]|uniref:DUF3955 domain-containing protein n=1 Tax=Bacillus kandeliae TaxID=3129297 RepID=A0ABZ2N4F7_9BACI